MADAQANLEAYQQLHDLTTAGAFDWLICKDRSRLARTLRLNQEVAAFLEDHGIRIYSRAFPPANIQERSEADIWGKGIEGTYAEVEIERLKRRREMGMQARTRRGEFPNRLPWGFSRAVSPDGKESKVVFSDARAEEAVRFAISRFQQGISKLRIVEESHIDGLRSPLGQPWRLQTVDDIVFQPAYYGLVAYGRRRGVTEDGRRKMKRLPFEEWTIAKGNFEAPFTPQDWEATLQENERRRKEHPRRRSSCFPLSGIAWCLPCDTPMTGTTTRGRFHYYRCTPQSWGRGHDAQPHRHHMPDGKLHRQMFDYMAKLASEPATLQALLEQQPKPEWDLQARHKGLTAQLAQCEERRRRWYEAYEGKVIELADFARQLDEVDEEREAIDGRLKALEAKMQQAQKREDMSTVVAQALADLPENPEELSRRQREMLRKIFSDLFRRVYVEEKRIVGAELNL